MSATEERTTSREANVGQVDMKLEVQIIPVSNVDRAKQFYRALGWRLDDDVAPMEGLRIVQFTPPGSGTSITFGQGLTTAAPGAAEGGLIVSDIEAAHDELVRRGIDVSDIWHGPPFPVEARQPGPDPERNSYGSFCLLHRSRQQYVAGPGGHDPAPRPNERHGDGLRIRGGPGERACARRGRPPRAREAHWAVAPVPPLRPRQQLARLVRRLHDGRTGRDRLAFVTVPRSPRPPRLRQPGQRGLALKHLSEATT